MKEPTLRSQGILTFVADLAELLTTEGECMCKPWMESLKSHTIGRRIQGTVPGIFLSTYQVPSHGDQHTAHKRLSYSPNSFMKSRVKFCHHFADEETGDLESSSDLHVVTQRGGGKAGIQPRSNTPKPALIRIHSGL